MLAMVLGEADVINAGSDQVGVVVGGEEEEDLLIEVIPWAVEQGLPESEFLFELADAESGRAHGVLDPAWPDRMQEGLSVPVALLLNEPEETQAAAIRAGYCYFTDVD